MAIDNTTVVPKLVAARLVDKYRETRVFAQRTNRAWQGMLANGGNTVQRNTVNEAVVADYVVDTDIVYTSGDVTALGDLSLTKQKYWAVKLDDIPAIQSVSGILDATVASAGQVLAAQVDTDVRDVFDTSATAGPAIALDHDDFALGRNAADYPQLTDLGLQTMHRLLDLQSVPRAGRWLIIGPYGAEYIQAMALESAILGAAPAAPLVNGNIGSFGGFNIYVHGATHSALAVAVATEEWFFGNDTAVSFIDQVRRIEQIRLQEGFEDAVRGLYTYGAKMDFATRVYKSTATISNVPA